VPVPQYDCSEAPLGPVASLYKRRLSRRHRRMLGKVIENHSCQRDPKRTHRLVRIFLARIVQTDSMLRRNKRCRQIPPKHLFLVRDLWFRFGSGVKRYGLSWAGHSPMLLLDASRRSAGAVALAVFLPASYRRVILSMNGVCVSIRRGANG
jgi:hypothetical protein